VPAPLFVYGSLMRGQAADGYLADRRIRAATVRGFLYRVPAGYPALVVDPSGEPIHGELVLDTDPGLLMVLDIYESVGSGLYHRTPVEAVLKDQRSGQRSLFGGAHADTIAAQAYVVSGRQARARRYHRLKATDWRTVAPRGR